MLTVTPQYSTACVMFGNCALVRGEDLEGSPRGKREQRAFLHMVVRIFDSPLEAVIEMVAGQMAVSGRNPCHTPKL
jgi:hypothetical protein